VYVKDEPAGAWLWVRSEGAADKKTAQRIFDAVFVR
jgi:hypothetical protein